MPLTFPSNNDFQIPDWVAFDIETASCALQPGIFKTYAVGACTADQKMVSVADTARQLHNHRCIWDALDFMVEVERARPRTMAGEKDETGPLFAVGHNISKFDSIEVLHAIFQDMKVAISGMIQSNGRVITFTIVYQGSTITFIDSFLFTMGSLAAVAESLGLKTEKLTLPHKYLQNVPTWTEVHL